DAIEKLGLKIIESRYGNLFDMYKKITGIDAYKEPMQISPAPHFSMGGLWVDYELMTTIPGLFAIGECNFADHGANRLGANSLLQASIDGYFILPLTIGNYLVDELKSEKASTDDPAFIAAYNSVVQKFSMLINNKGSKTVDSIHRRLGKIMWKECAMSRNQEGLTKAIEDIRELRDEFYKEVKVTGSINEFNQELDKASRLIDFLEMAELMCIDALERRESCGAHFREEFQSADGEALRNDEDFSYVSAWEYKNESQPILNKEILNFEYVTPTVRSYK
ncbi:MAG: FAD-binding protein, partial [Bdellovibrionales bacterium]|nr:FAD-binding protein [Bdellovibrionales bacterium]